MDARATNGAEDGAAAAVPQDGPGGLLALLRTLGPGRIAALGAVALVLLSFFAFVAWRVSAPEYTILFAGLQLADAERLTQRLDALGVPYRLSGGGDAVMVPADRALKLRMSLAEEGQPVGSTVGYELLDKAGPFGNERVPGQHQPAPRHRRRARPLDRHPAPGPLGARPHQPAEARAVRARRGAADGVDRPGTPRRGHAREEPDPRHQAPCRRRRAGARPGAGDAGRRQRQPPGAGGRSGLGGPRRHRGGGLSGRPRAEA